MRKALNELIGAMLVTIIQYPATTVLVAAVMFWLGIKVFQ